VRNQRGVCRKRATIRHDRRGFSRGDAQGTRLLEMNVDNFVAPALTGLRADFITARAAARPMVQHGGGAILMLTSGSGLESTPPEFSDGQDPVPPTPLASV